MKILLIVIKKKNLVNCMLSMSMTLNEDNKLN